MKLLNARHKWRENSDFSMNRPFGLGEYVFLHFYNDVNITFQDRTETAHSGACLIYNIGTPQIWQSDGLLTHDWMHISSDFERLIKSYNLPTDKILYVSDDKKISDIMTDIEAEFMNVMDNREEMMEILLKELCILLSRVKDKSNSYKKANNAVYERFCNLRIGIHKNPEKPWSIDILASKANLSPSRFHRIYKSFFKVTPNEDIINSRIELAKYYITSTDMTVSEIAEKVGYSNTTHFCRQFKKKCGYSASEYKKISCTV